MKQAITADGGAKHWGWRARAVAAVLRRSVHLFFREVEIVGVERIPSGVPLVVVANHVNGIIDPVLVGLLRLQARFLAKSTLWKHPVIRPILGATGAIPVHRHQDHADTAKNAGSFDRCHDALARGETIALFPEGKSHDGVGLAPLKTGAARIVLEAEAKHGALGVRVLPVGLTFDAKNVFRSRALVRVGEPIDPSADGATWGRDPHAAVRRLTERIARGLETVTTSHAAWRHSRLVERGRAIAPRDGVPCDDLVARHPDETLALARAMERYDRLRTTLRIPDDEATAYDRLRVGARLVGRAAAWLPLAIVGTVVSWIPYRLIGVATKRFASADVQATYKLFAGLFVFPLWWSACAAWVWHVAGPMAGVATLPLAAIASHAAMMFDERSRRLHDDARVLLRPRDAVVRELVAARAAVVAAVRNLDEAGDGMASRQARHG